MLKLAWTKSTHFRSSLAVPASTGLSGSNLSLAGGGSGGPSPQAISPCKGMQGEGGATSSVYQLKRGPLGSARRKQWNRGWTFGGSMTQSR